MGESLISRRGGSGTAKLNIFNGSSVPTAQPYGIFGQTTSTINNIRFTDFANTSDSAVTKLPLIGVNLADNSAMVFYNNYIYTFATDRVYRAPYSGNTWSTLLTGGNTIISSACTVYNNNIYSLSFASNTTPVYVYSISSNTASLDFYVSHVSSSYSYASAAGKDNFFYYVVGNSSGSNTIYKVDIVSKARSSFSTMYGNIMKSGATVHNNLLYFFGGGDSDYGGVRSVSINISSGVLTLLTNVPSNILYSAVSAIGSSIYVAGYGTTNVFKYSIISNSWTTLPIRFAQASVRSQGITFGNYVMLKNQYGVTTISVDGDNYPSGTMVIETGVGGKPGTILVNKTTQVDEFVKNIYYHNGTSLTRINGSVRKNGGSWTTL